MCHFQHVFYRSSSSGYVFPVAIYAFLLQVEREKYVNIHRVNVDKLSHRSVATRTWLHHFCKHRVNALQEFQLRDFTKYSIFPNIHVRFTTTLQWRKTKYPRNLNAYKTQDKTLRQAKWKCCIVSLFFYPLSPIDPKKADKEWFAAIHRIWVFKRTVNRLKMPFDLFERETLRVFDPRWPRSSSQNNFRFRQGAPPKRYPSNSLFLLQIYRSTADKA